jgi:hypothetical protein
MLFGQRSQERQESIKVLLGQLAELLGDEFALAHVLSTSNFTVFPSPERAPATIANSTVLPDIPTPTGHVFSRLRLCVNRSLSGGD